jgi:hypothetical protein
LQSVVKAIGMVEKDLVPLADHHDHPDLLLLLADHHDHLDLLPLADHHDHPDKENVSTGNPVSYQITSNK